MEKLIKNLSEYNCVILYNSAARNTASRQFGATMELVNIIKTTERKTCRVLPSGHTLRNRPVQLPSHGCHYRELFTRHSRTTICRPSHFGGINVNGKFPVSINHYYPAGTGLSTPKLRLGYYQPESCGMDSQTLLKIDSICQAAIKVKATPGCQVLVAKDGYIIYNKAFGFNTYDKKKKTRPTTYTTSPPSRK